MYDVGIIIKFLSHMEFNESMIVKSFQCWAFGGALGRVLSMLMSRPWV